MQITLPTILREMRLFLIVWVGQLITCIGSSITAFALDVWVYERTGSVTQFALVTLFNTLPLILVSPIAGPLADRWDKRWMMILSDLFASVGTLVIGGLFIFGRLEVWHIYLANIFSSTFLAFQWPAYYSSTSVMVPKQHLGRANGMMSLLTSIARIVAPPLGGVFLGLIHLQGIILIDFITMFFAIVPLMVLRFPEIKTPTEQTQANSFLDDITYGWKYLISRPGLLGLMAFSALSFFLIGAIQVITTPLILTFASVTVLGTVLSITGSGMLLGGLIITIWAINQHSINIISISMVLSGVFMFTAGLRPSLVLFTVSIFFIFLLQPITSSIMQAIFQRKVEIGVQGRVFSIRGAIEVGFIPLGYITIGPLAEKVFEPFMATDGILANSIGKIIGFGQGRGMGLLLMIMGVLTILATGIAYLYPPLQRVEDELPDAILDASSVTDEVVSSSPNTVPSGL
jgi:DHA3 family macrolide efflux protein-like MFS transporter